MKFFCPRCGQKLACNDDEQGTVMGCPGCSNVITVPVMQPMQAQLMQAQLMQAQPMPTQAMPAQPIQINIQAPESQIKINPASRLVFVILGLIFGLFGIHNFYAGYAGRGLLQFLLTTCSLGLLSPFIFFWVILELILITEDARGIPFQ